MIGSQAVAATESNACRIVLCCNNIRWWRHCSETKDCEYDVTSELLVPPPSTSPDSDPYRRDAQLEVQRLPQTGTGSAIYYQLFNTSRSAAPFLRFEIPRDVSVLREVYDPTTVTDDHTLRAELSRQPTRAGWVLTVSGRLHRCPGRLASVIVHVTSFAKELSWCDRRCLEEDLLQVCL